MTSYTIEKNQGVLLIFNICVYVLQAALRPRGQQAKAHRVGEDVFCVLVEGLLLALSDKSSSQYFRRKGVALEGEFDGISYFDELGEEHIVEGCHLSGFGFLIYTTEWRVSYDIF